MKIIHKIDVFLFTIFPSVKDGDIESLKEAVLEYYTYGGFKPKVSIEGIWITIEIDTSAILSQESDYKRVITLCEKGKFHEAKPILKNLILKNPTNSEYHRIMGQILSEEGDQEEAINFLLDALRWDSKNGWALLMMGNIFAKYKNDLTTAMKYYDQALIANPNDNITINNIGAFLIQQGKIEQGKKYLTEAMKINNQYPNTLFALAMVAEIEKDLQTAFHGFIQAIKHNKNKDGLYKTSLNQALEIARKVISSQLGSKNFREYRYKLEFEGDRKIDLISDEEIQTPAKFEFAENFDRENHIVKYKPNYPAIDHLIMHELVHLDFVIQARKQNLNKLFISNQNHKIQFISGLDSTIKKLTSMGVPESSIKDLCNNLFNGLNLQVYNTPIDLFIE